MCIRDRGKEFFVVVVVVWCGGEVRLCGYMVWYQNSGHPTAYLVLQGVAQIADFSFLTLLQ